MSRQDVDAFLAEADDVIADWEGSADSATWAADGSHQRDTGGHYYGDDINHAARLFDRLVQARAAQDWSIGDAAFTVDPATYQAPTAEEVTERWRRLAEGARVIGSAIAAADLIWTMDPDPEPPVVQLAEGDVIAIDWTRGPIERYTIAHAVRRDDATISITLTEETP
jgi:hypothetical protein